jgi:hypothetical protein
MGKNPKKWLAEQRQLKAVELLKKCSCLKAAATDLKGVSPTYPIF